VRDYQAAMSLDAWRYDAVLMGERVARPRPFDWADVDGRVVARGALNWDYAAVHDGLEGGRLGCRGIAFYIIVELQHALARCCSATGVGGCRLARKRTNPDILTHNLTTVRNFSPDSAAVLQR
jgi:hypothetical protein